MGYFYLVKNLTTNTKSNDIFPTLRSKNKGYGVSIKNVTNSICYNQKALTCLAWDEEQLFDIITSCIIMHDMIVEEERDTYINQANDRKCIGDRPHGHQKVQVD